MDTQVSDMLMAYPWLVQYQIRWEGVATTAPSPPLDPAGGETVAAFDGGRGGGDGYNGRREGGSPLLLFSSSSGNRGKGGDTPGTLPAVSDSYTVPSAA
uniref:Uncharacterized protein n=1 Tax=Oryza sativa subsp. japonica TaxID=39947 RepID=Q6YW49_ORYSJ|nr:hypothetical protein [Oryza sativa Japonica Group]BAD17611.1 hypothetical protein [Oryza sativa Japonica Group]